MERRIARPAARVAAGWVNHAVCDEAERRRQEQILTMLFLAAATLPALLGPALMMAVPAAGAASAAAAVSGACLLLAAILNLTASRVATAIAFLTLALAGALLLGMMEPLAGRPALLAPLLLGGGAGAVIAVQTMLSSTEHAAQPEARDDFVMALDLMPGLLTVHDARGDLVRVGGSDIDAFSGWLDLKPGDSFVERLHVADRLAFMQVQDRLRQGEDRLTLEARLARRAGSGAQFEPVVCEFVAMRDDDGMLSAVLVQTRSAADIDRLRAERDCLAGKAASAESEKTRFLAAVSHELRTPLNAIIGFSEILGREFYGPLSDQRQREYVGLIRQSGDHLLSVVNTMLDMSKIEAGSYRLSTENFAVGDAIDECMAMLALDVEKRRLTLTSRVARNCGELIADRHALKQMLINLIGNAIKFTEPGGAITVDAVCDGPSMKLTVADTGIGMEQHVLDNLGQPFVQGQRDYARHHEGTGLGLCLVQGLARLHGGRMTIESAPGRGTAVTIALPLDGSGIHEQNMAEAARVTVFPPRLTARKEEPVRQETGNDATKKTA